MTSSNLKGCQKVAGGRTPRRPPEKVISHDRTPKGCQTSGQRKFRAKDLAPLRGATQSLAFPVVSADCDHRLLSLQPFGLLRSVNYIVIHFQAFSLKWRKDLDSEHDSSTGLERKRLACNRGTRRSSKRGRLRSSRLILKPDSTASRLQIRDEFAHSFTQMPGDSAIVRLTRRGFLSSRSIQRRSLCGRLCGANPARRQRRGRRLPLSERVRKVYSTDGARN